jgi:hypothetical protein
VSRGLLEEIAQQLYFSLKMQSSYSFLEGGREKEGREGGGGGRREREGRSTGRERKGEEGSG